MTLISVEGIDGTGKSTLIAALAAALSERGVDVLTLREPGGVALSERIRSLVADPALEISDRAEALLYAAARAELVHQRLEPALRQGQTVLLDRYVDSSLAYQGGGRGLGVEAIAAINAFATGGLAPDRTLWLALDPALAAARAAGRTLSSGVGPDRIEQAGAGFFARAHASYAALAQADPERIRVLDAAAAPEDVLAAALAAMEDLVG